MDKWRLGRKLLSLINPASIYVGTYAYLVSLTLVFIKWYDF